MSITELFSKRQKRLRGDVPDVYQYSEIPHPLRVQIVHIWESAFGPREDSFGYSSGATTVFGLIHDQLCREYGVFKLHDSRGDKFEIAANFMLTARDTDQVLDVIELSFKMLDVFVRDRVGDFNASQSVDDAIAELNHRFREHGVGFQFESGEIIKVNSQFVHAEVVQPALALLRGKHLKGANEEFLSAHQHYRERKHKECLNDCLKAFESTMKAICKSKGWTYKPTDTAKALLDVLYSNQLFPDFLQSHFGGLRSTLEGGVPTIRNKLGGHGQGPETVTVPDEVAAYALHLTATNIVFLIKIAGI